jgi:hypothetical protein
VTLAENGIAAELTAKQNLKMAYKRFMAERQPSKKEEAGRDLACAIFGTDAIAKDSIL